MQLYNASTTDGLRNYTRFLTRTDADTFPNDDLDAAINQYYRVLVNEAIQSICGWDFRGDTATADIVAGQQEYTLPDDILQIKRVEVTYDGTGGNTHKAFEFDINETGEGTSSTKISSNFSSSEPYVEMFDNSIFLYPVPTQNVTAGIKIWYNKKAADLINETDVPVIQEAYHKAICYGAARDYLEANIERDGFALKAQKAEINYERLVSKMKEYYTGREPDRHYEVMGAIVDYS